MRVHALLVAASSLLLSACEIFNDDSTDIDTGVITVDTYTDGGAGFQVFPLAIFYRDADLTFNLPELNTCRVLRYVPDNDDQVANFPTMNVGASIQAALPGGTADLVANSNFGVTVYRPDVVMPHAPGDTLRIVVPSNDQFSASTIAVRTAEAFTLGPVGTTETNQNLTVEWTAPPEPGAFMQLALRYETETSQGGLNEQTVCMFADTGEGVIFAGNLVGWNNAMNDNREAVATRIRSRVVEVNSTKRLIAISTFTVPTELFTP